VELTKYEIINLLDTIQDGIIAINKESIITIFNKSATDITGIDGKSALGKNIVGIVPNTRLHIVLNTGIEELNWQQIVGNTNIITSRFPLKNNGGDIIGAVAVFRDISQIQHLAERITNLKEMQTMLEAIIQSTQDAITVANTNGHGVIINSAYTRLTGLTKEDVIGKPVTVDIAEGESMHLKVLSTKLPVKNVPMKVGPNKKEVLVDVAPIIVDGVLKGTVGVLHDVSEIRRLSEELDTVKRLIRKLEAKYTFDDIIGESKVMLDAIELAKKAANTPATILLRGESGTGKELFAHAIHNSSPQKYQQFIRVNCAALTDSLLESELFGYVEGAFTGAKKGGKKGLFEEAEGGTIFLDEIGEISSNLQSKLLRVLQEKEIVRVGSTKSIPINARVIAATNVNLEIAVKGGSFRKDLYYRLNVMPIFIPSLREKREDISLLVKFLIRKFNQEYGRSVSDISEDVSRIILQYSWPGNVRELENILGRAIINMKYGESIIKREHIPVLAIGNEQTSQKPNQREFHDRTLDDILSETEKLVIIEALKETDGNKTEAARRLGIATRSLYYKLEKYNL
jgi:PAS domain S-box-containing protein